MEPLSNIETATMQIPPKVGPSGDDAVPSGSGLITGNGVIPTGNKSVTTAGSASVNNISTGAIRKKREDKRSKRDQRSWDNLLKSISSLPECEKLEIIKEKYTDLYNEYRTIVTSNKTIEKQLKNIKKEKDHVQIDLVKNILSRTKLENLARELQKQNKDIKEENYNRLKEEEEKRKEVAASFTEKLNTLTQLMDENKDKSIRLRDENLNMTSKLTELYQQFQERENHVTNINRQMELQKQLSDTQLKKREFEFETEHEIWKKEKAMLIANLERSGETNKVLQDNVNSLQEHLNSYQKQYSDFEVTMKRSNMVFDAFKDEMSNMHRANSVLEKDRNEWHSQWRSTTQKCLTLSEAKNKLVEDLQLKQKKLDALEKLCRKLNVERSNYLQQLKLLNITPVTPVDDEAVSAPTPPTPPTASEVPIQPDNASDPPGERSTADFVETASPTSLASESVCNSLEKLVITNANSSAAPVANTFNEDELKIVSVLTPKLNENTTEVESDTASSVQPLSSSEHSDPPVDYTSELTHASSSSGTCSETPKLELSVPEESSLTPTTVTKTEEPEASTNE